MKGGQVVGDGSWTLTVFVTDLQVERRLRVRGDLHIGGVLRPLVQPIVRGGLTARWNVGQSDADVRTILRSLDGSWWGLDIRVILH